MLVSFSYWKRVCLVYLLQLQSRVICIRISSLQLKMLHLYSNQGSSEVLSAKKSEKYSSVFEYMLKRLKIQQTEVKNFLPFVQVI